MRHRGWYLYSYTTTLWDVTRDWVAWAQSLPQMFCFLCYLSTPLSPSPTPASREDPSISKLYPSSLFKVPFGLSDGDLVKDSSTPLGRAPSSLWGYKMPFQFWLGSEDRGRHPKWTLKSHCTKHRPSKSHFGQVHSWPPRRPTGVGYSLADSTVYHQAVSLRTWWVGTYPQPPTQARRYEWQSRP